MKEVLSKIAKTLARAGHTIKDKVVYGFSFLIAKITKKGGKPGSRGLYAGRQGGRDFPGAPVASVRAASVSSRQRSMMNGGNKKSIFAFFARLANKRRFATVLSVAAAAVLVPVIAVAAAGGAETRIIEETVPPQSAEFIPSPTVEPAVPVVEETGVSVVEATPEPTATPEPEPVYLALEPESTHADVAKLQQRLMELHYMDNDEPTEYYGQMTQQAVTYFQRKHELTMDGAAGPVTQDLLFSDAAKPYSVTLGAEGEDVGNIQYRLQELGYEVGVTGYFGEDTASNVKYFQRMNGLTDDGSVGQDTKDILFSEQAEPSEEFRKQQSSAGSSGSGKKKGSSGGGGGGGSTSHVADPGNVEAMINVALAMQGVTYKTGGKGPDSFDCSGLVYYALKESGNGIGYMTSGGWASSSYATVGSMGDLQRGDIICFSGHVAIYLGDGMMVDASSSQGCVVVRSCTGSWSKNNFKCGKRPL